ncbi:hypothetical protein MTR67_053314 [Solanum verrucosum]|uniref:Uncharacterized protein n=1 Tax=Solanum verrucosum TaxID=315347 RepID=A0AAF1A463_SOLVR|nr:hypothetical protein MTR67_053314 [Solanum verrucosum]
MQSRRRWKYISKVFPTISIAAPKSS